MNQQSQTSPAAMPPLPSYHCRKVVRAAKVVDYSLDIQPGIHPLRLMLEAPGEDGLTMTSRCVPDNWQEKPDDEAGLAGLVGGYYVEDSDGYTSWSPAKAFEDDYSLPPSPQADPQAPDAD